MEEDNKDLGGKEDKINNRKFSVGDSIAYMALLVGIISSYYTIELNNKMFQKQINDYNNKNHYEWISRLYRIKTRLFNGIDNDIKMTCNNVYNLKAISEINGLSNELLDELRTIGALATYAGENQTHDFYRLARNHLSDKYPQVLRHKTYTKENSDFLAVNLYKEHFTRYAAAISIEQILLYKFNESTSATSVLKKFDEYVNELVSNEIIKNQFLPTTECKTAFKQGKNSARIHLLNLINTD
ncbi:hypothetical protein [Colwellia sp. UCD-KL20]|uniref:hypothetical protein n=1 Tax=Colwellia sp. UCD-KL20 TaxID=1917165 RepID=UPI0009703604|nr:hypothetical protein [Colwellia sp. UCD-KL20]